MIVGSRLFIRAFFLLPVLIGSSLFATSEQIPYVDGFILTQILQHTDVSNSDLIELSGQSHAMKQGADDLMVGRLKSWLSEQEKLGWKMMPCFNTQTLNTMDKEFIGIT